MLELNNVHCGDAVTLLKSVEPNSIAVSVWSPPYYVGKDYEKHLSYEGWKTLLKDAIGNHFNVLKPGGFLVINIADILCFADENIPKFQADNVSKRRIEITREQVLKAIEENPGFNRGKLANLLGCSEQTIDRRLNGNNIRGGKYNTQTRVHLVGDILERSAYKAGLYLYDHRIWKKDPAWQNSKWISNSYRSVSEHEDLYFFWKPGITKVNRQKLTPEEWNTWGSRAIWEFPSVRANNDHEAKFPIELPRRVIKLLSEEGDVILDCFMGSGTTAIAALQESRQFIGIELNQPYVELAQTNIKKWLKTSEELRRQIAINF